ncbi:MAG: cyclase family protein [Candidatus Brocadiia bacterium]
MRIYDVSVTLRDGMPIYPGDEGYRRDLVSSIEWGDSANNSVLHMGAHTGTHLDAPWHMGVGEQRVDQIPPATLIGPARVVEIRNRTCIERAELEECDWDGVERALLKTANSGRLRGEAEFDPEFIYLTGEGAEFLAGLGLTLVGVDYLSVDRLHSGTHPAHLALMEAGVVVVEGLDLADVPPGDYELFCAPLKIGGGDGAPARAFLRAT